MNRNIDILEGLNPSQKRAVETLKGPLLILAGAGTGKTKVITHRIANLLKNWVSPESILGLTFTNKAAKEMKERIRNITSAELTSKIFLGTFHSFCLRVLREEVTATKLFRGFTIADDLDQAGILKQIISELKINEDDSNVSMYSYEIGKLKQELIPYQDYSKKAKTYRESLVARVYQKYQERLIAQNMLDFDDILSYVVDLWRNSPIILDKYQDRYKYILIDEFQDTNYAQFSMVKLLADRYRNICVVGDDDQSIYGWRGAKIENILDFPKTYLESKVIKLEQNYRSTSNILNIANAFMDGTLNRHKKILWSKNGEGSKINCVTLKSDSEEAYYVSDQIKRIICSDYQIKYSDIAILYRSNHQSRTFEEQFRRSKLPYKIVGSNSFFEKKEIRDSVAYLKIATNSKDDQNLLRILGVPSRGLGEKFIENARVFQKETYGKSLLDVFIDERFIKNLTTKQAAALKTFTENIHGAKGAFSTAGNISDKARKYFAGVGFLNCFQKIYKNIDEAEDRKENVLEFLDSMAEFEDSQKKEENKEISLNDYLEAFSLSKDDTKSEDEDENKNSVTFLTVHSAKGLEFKCVFIVGMEQNIFPHARSIENMDVEEERRLFYVAITRAKEMLYITNAKNRYQFGKPCMQQSSDFLLELPQTLVDYTEVSSTPADNKKISIAFSDFYKEFSD